MRVLITGGRNFKDRALMWSTLDWLHAEHHFTLLIHSDARGADRLADEWAQEQDIQVLNCPADRKRYGRAAGTAPVKVLIFCRFRTYVRILPRCSRESVRWCSHDSMISYVTDGVTGSPLKQERQGCCLANGSRSLSSPAR